MAGVKLRGAIITLDYEGKVRQLYLPPKTEIIFVMMTSVCSNPPLPLFTKYILLNLQNKNMPGVIVYY